MIGSLIAHGNAIRIIFGVLVGIVGIAFTALEFIPSISPPENFRTEGHVLADDDEEDIIWGAQLLQEKESNNGEKSIGYSK